MALIQVLPLSLLLLLALPAVLASPPVSVISFGAQPNIDTNEAALKNSAALRNALEHVQVGDSKNGRTRASVDLLLHASFPFLPSSSFLLFATVQSTRSH
jgi:hypothetical protein